MIGKLINCFSERWADWTIWQGCQVKDQSIVEHSSINHYYALQTLSFLGLITSNSQSL